MGWTGKMVGGGIGFFIGGPLGAVAGAAFGHMFDSENSQALLLDESAFSSEERGQFVFFVSTFSMLAKVAKADGQVTKPEVEAVRLFMTHDLNLNAQSRSVADQIFRQGLTTPEGFSAFAGQFYREFQDNTDLLEMLIDIMFRVAVADGNFHRKQEELISRAADIFRMPREVFRKLRSRHVTGLAEDCYSRLGCSPQDSNEDIRKQYRKMARDFHPDTIASKGLPEDFIAFANTRFREIQEAWEAIRKERNM
jgi:DnaJ like chaperone protein